MRRRRIPRLAMKDAMIFKSRAVVAFTPPATFNWHMGINFNGCPSLATTNASVLLFGGDSPLVPTPATFAGTSACG